MANRRLKLTVELEPRVLQWARERAGFDSTQLAAKLKVKPQVVCDWEETGEIAFDKVDALSKRTFTPVGFLYLAEPPDVSLPIADFRARQDTPTENPSPNLLEIVYQMQRRQLWMRDELIYQESPPLGFVGAFDLDSPIDLVAAAMGEALGLNGGWAAADGNWTNALRTLRDRIDSARVLVVFNGVVGNDTHRKLDPDEFQGFALSDEYAPLIFVNNADYKTAQIFTLVHELAHIFVNEPGLSKLENLHPAAHRTEEVCNKIAAEFLVPSGELRSFWPSMESSVDPFQAAARRFKVSTVVAARRAFDTGLISRFAFFDYYRANKETNWTGSQSNDALRGGNFWNNQHWRLGTRLGASVMRAVKEGRLSYREAYNLTGLKGNTFVNMPEKMGFAL